MVVFNTIVSILLIIALVVLLIIDITKNTDYEVYDMATIEQIDLIENYLSYIKSNDIQILKNKPLDEFTYEEAEDLIYLLTNRIGKTDEEI